MDDGAGVVGSPVHHDPHEGDAEGSETGMERTYDVVVIGGGPAGENVAGRAVEHGLEVALVEEELLGGECSYWACMPSKALLRPTEALAAARRLPSVEAALTGTLDVAAVLRSRDAFTSHLDDTGQQQWVEGAGVTLERGRGRLAGERLVEVTRADGQRATLTARRGVVVATGSRAAWPPIPGLAESGAWDNRAATTTQEVPRRLVVLGGGVVGVELAQAFARLGSEAVTVVEMADRLLPREEPFAGEELAAALAGDGVDVRTGLRATAVERAGPGAPVTLRLEGGGDVEADELLVAVGRRPATDDLGLERVGLASGGFLPVDDRLVVDGVEGDWLLAVGDVNGRSLLTHTGKYQARIAADLLADLPAIAWGDREATPRVVFTDPQVAAVGRTEAEAREAGLAVRTVRYGTGDVAGAALLGKGVAGTSQLVIDEDRDVILGATFTGPGVGELLHAATIAIVGEVSLDVLWHAVPAFPTVSEVWLRLLETDGR